MEVIHPFEIGVNKMRLTEEEMYERRETMIQTAFHLFCERGIENVPLSEIAKKAQVGENTLYRYFDNKETLVQEAFVKLWNTIMQNVEHIVENVPDYDSLNGYAQIEVWIKGFRQLYQADKDFVLFSFEAKLYLLRQNIKPDRFKQDTSMYFFRSSCLAALDKGKADGSIAITENSEDVFYAIWSAVQGFIIEIVIYIELYGECSSWERQYELLETGILNALSSGKILLNV